MKKIGLSSVEAILTSDTSNERAWRADQEYTTFIGGNAYAYANA